MARLHALPVVMLGLLAGVASSAADGEPLKPATTTVRGVVVDEHDRPLSWVQVRCREVARLGAETQEDGRFEFEGVPVGTCTLSAWILGVPGNGPAPDVAKTFPTDAEAVVRVRRGAELVVRGRTKVFPGSETTREIDPNTLGTGPGTLRFHGATFVRTESMSHGATRLYVEAPKGWTSWYAAVDGGRLAFRRIVEGRPFALFVAWSPVTGGTALLSGPKLSAEPLDIDLEPGAPIQGLASVPPSPELWSGPPRDRLVARRGPVQVPGWVNPETRSFSTPPLPAGPWEVTLSSGRETVSVTAEAGATVALVLPPPEPIPLPRTTPKRGPTTR